ncbi:MAG: hypothetical protein KDI36_00245 [Pseudomonadales bacterium]|nr:hypothetical protein [Pseudomonadales bacterium]
MQHTPAEFREWINPDPGQIGESVTEFLSILERPTWITIDGIDNTRSRTIVTLLHANEPSGLKAVHRILRAGLIPATRLGIFVASVNAALEPPLLSHRYLPGEEDFNRCFNPPYETDQRRLAAALLTKLHAFQPEAVIDTHNTSGHSAAFAVAIRDDEETVNLAGRFTDKLIIIDQALGTLIEQREGHCPIVTVEFGGYTDPNADRLAYETLREFISAPELTSRTGQQVKILKHSLRLELQEGHQVHYGSTVRDQTSVTIFNTIDQLNFETLEAGSPIGWPAEDGLGGLMVKSATGEDLTETYLAIRDGFIVTNHRIIIFMATTDSVVAEQDCLLYLTPLH